MKLNHLGEPDNSKELEITSYNLERVVVDELRGQRSANYMEGLTHKRALHEHMLKLCEDYSTTLDIIHNKTMVSLHEVVELTPRQDVRVREAILNAMVITATTAEGYTDDTRDYVMTPSEREEGLYSAVYDFEERQRETINTLWEKVNN